MCCLGLGHHKPSWEKLTASAASHELFVGLRSYLMHVTSEQLIIFLKPLYKALWRQDACFLFLSVDLHDDTWSSAQTTASLQSCAGAHNRGAEQTAPGQTSLLGKSTGCLLRLWVKMLHTAAAYPEMDGRNRETVARSLHSRCCQSSQSQNSVLPQETLAAPSLIC